MPRKPTRTKRYNNQPFSLYDYKYFLHCLMKNPAGEPEQWELDELRLHGLTIEGFRKNYTYYKKHYEDLLKADRRLVQCRGNG